MNLIPPNEDERLLAVRRYDILDTPPDGAFDRITALAARLLQVPISIVSIVDYDRIWFKSHHGVDVPQIARDPGLCASAILGEGPWIIENAIQDVRALANPLVAGEFGLRFYAGVPLRTADGFNLGTLCVIGKQARTVTNDEIRLLSDLAAIVVDELELRLSARTAVASMEEEIRERELAQERQRLLLHELSHRVKNTLATVRAIASQTGRSTRDTAEFMAKFEGRLAALARAHDFLTADQWEGGSLRSLVELSVRPYQDETGRVALAGPDLRLQPTAALALNLVLHELATNAAKHGALSVPHGRLQVRWGVERPQDGDESVVLRWAEESDLEIGGPPSRHGFGSFVLTSLVSHELGGSTQLAYAPPGLKATLTVPLGPNFVPAAALEP